MFGSSPDISVYIVFLKYESAKQESWTRAMIFNLESKGGV